MCWSFVSLGKVMNILLIKDLICLTIHSLPHPAWLFVTVDDCLFTIDDGKHSTENFEYNQMEICKWILSFFLCEHCAKVRMCDAWRWWWWLFYFRNVSTFFNSLIVLDSSLGTSSFFSIVHGAQLERAKSVRECRVASSCYFSVFFFRVYRRVSSLLLIFSSESMLSQSLSLFQLQSIPVVKLHRRSRLNKICDQHRLRLISISLVNSKHIDLRYNKFSWFDFRFGNWQSWCRHLAILCDYTIERKKIFHI